MKVALFLKESKILFNNGAKKLCIVIGNQSADLDSIASAISLAHYLNQATEEKKFIPIINSKKSVIASKKTCTYMFEQLSVDLNDLVFLEDLTHNRIGEVYLVDHNELDKRESEDLRLSELVTGVIDHHLDKGEFKNANPRCIDTRVGSNASLIVSMFTGIELDPSFANLLLFPIVNDTSNLTRIAHQIDIDAVEYLTRFTSVDRNQLAEKLDGLKFNSDSSETVSELLRQDLKIYTGSWAMSAMNKGLVEWIRRGVADILEFMDENSLVFFGILSLHREEGAYKRDLVIFGEEQMVRGFVELKRSDLTLIDTSYSQTNCCAIFKVNDSTLSRKYWQPVLEKYLRAFY